MFFFWTFGEVRFLTDVEFVSEVADSYTGELGADEAEDPVCCDCGGGASGFGVLVGWVVVFLGFRSLGFGRFTWFAWRES